ncbi:MAG: D-alanyl-D-alanine carboxypeptidase/D-alanyl-D-alanine-endopeptidase [Gemmatimonadales bacterium]|nr:MAG: D-alanyl-D-alanine carboxypeptidase/D-alanyl-D-alanine-endopeptidase [Gemmatimonadales bacterium]
MRHTAWPDPVRPLVGGLAMMILACALTPTDTLAQAAAEDARATAPLDVRVDAITGTRPLDRVHWGLLLMEASTGEILYARNPDLRFAPASNMKIPVTAAALELLGPEHRFETVFLAELPPDPDGRITGDLFVPGTGDPSLGEPFHASADAAVEALADSLVSAGVRRIEGRLMVDVSAWDSTSVPTAWLVGNLPRTAAATGGAFAIGMGELEIEVTGGAAPGDPATVNWRPMGGGSFVESRLVTVPAGGGVDVRDQYLPESRRWVLEGMITPGARRTLSRAQRDPVRQAANALYRAIEGRGIPIEGGLEILWNPGEPVLGGCRAGELPVCTGSVRIAGMASPPLSELVREILEVSQNWMTEQLVRVLGAEFGTKGSWDEGFEVITETLVQGAGIEAEDLHFRDGSGLAGYNLISPRALAMTLRWAAERPWGPHFRLAMAEPGKVNTTLSSRLPELRGRVFAKTGTISHSNALSGYLVSDSGEERIFVIFTNASNLPAAPVRAGIDGVTREFARP